MYLPYAFDTANVEITDLKSGDKSHILIVDNEDKLREFLPQRDAVSLIEWNGYNASITGSNLSVGNEHTSFINLDGRLFLFMKTKCQTY